MEVHEAESETGGEGMVALTFGGGGTDFNRLQHNDTIHSDTANAINLPRSDPVKLFNRSRFISPHYSLQFLLQLPLPAERPFYMTMSP